MQEDNERHFDASIRKRKLKKAKKEEKNIRIMGNK